MPNPLTPPPYQEDYQQGKWLEDLRSRFTGPFPIPEYTVVTLPDAAGERLTGAYTGIVYVSDEIGGGTVAYSDGTNWRRVQDRAIVTKAVTVNGALAAAAASTSGTITVT